MIELMLYECDVHYCMLRKTTMTIFHGVFLEKSWECFVKILMKVMRKYVDGT